MALLTRRRVFAAKTEGTIGTAEALTGAEAVYNALAFEIVPNIAVERREGQGGFNHLPGIPEVMSGTATIRHAIEYDGTNLPTWASVLLPACGYVESGGLFSPVSRGPGGAGLPKTVTIGQYHDGKLRRLAGCMGNFVITAPTGRQAFIEFTFQGKYFENETDTGILAPTYPTTKGLRFADGILTFNSVNLCTSTVTIDSGNEVILRECVGTGDRTGIRSALITNRAPVITADPEAVLVATQDRDALWLTSDPQAFSLTLRGTGNSTIVIAAPKAQLENKQPGDRNGMIIDNLTWLCTAGSAADTELTIDFNAAT